MPLESLHGQCKTQEVQWPGAICWISLPAALWGIAGLPLLTASLLMRIAGYGLEHHYGDTRVLEPSTTTVDLSDEEPLFVFISFTLLHPGQCEGQGSSLAPGLPDKELQHCPSKSSLPEGEQCWTLNTHAEQAWLGVSISPLHHRKTIHCSPWQCLSYPGTLFHKAQQDHRGTFSSQSQSL